MRASLAAMGGLFLGLTVLAVPAGAQQTTMPRVEIEQIVREYLLREPEVLVEALEKLQQRRQAAEAQAREDALSARAEAIFEDPGDPVVNPEGGITVVEFFDYRCHYCRGMAAELDAYLDEDSGVRMVFKEFPILGEESTRAAKAALAAELQGRYAEMHEILMRTRDFSQTSLEEIAGDLGLDVARFRTDMEGEPVATRIARNRALAGELGINGTPSFIVGKTLVPGAVPVERLAALVDEARKEKRAAAGG